MPGVLTAVLRYAKVPSCVGGLGSAPGHVRGWPGKKVRHFPFALMCVGVLVSCGRMESPRPTPQDLRRVEADFAQAWEVTVRTLTERGFEIRTFDRDAGTIETGWLTINPDYAATVLVTKREDRYCACGRPGLGLAYRMKQARLSLLLHPIRPGETGLRVEASFRTQRYSDALLWADRPLGEVECSSRGRLEEEIRVEIQIRALSDQLERLRRGAH